MMLLGGNPDLCKAVDATNFSNRLVSNILRLFRLRTPDAILNKEEEDGEKNNRTGSSGCSLCSGHQAGGENATTAGRF